MFARIGAGRQVSLGWRSGQFGGATNCDIFFASQLHFPAQRGSTRLGETLTESRLAMKTSCKISFALTLFTLSGFPAIAENVPLTCWYNAIAEFTSAEPASGMAVGSVLHSGSGNKSYSYTISARDGTACPVQLPLSTETALTVALVRQDSESCSNDNVSDAGQAPVGGSVTVFQSTENSMTAGVKLASASPNTTYRVFLKCGRQLGALRTDAEGNGGRTFNYLTDSLSPAYAFEIAPDGGGPGSKLQSLSLKK